MPAVRTAHGKPPQPVSKLATPPHTSAQRDHDTGRAVDIRVAAPAASRPNLWPNYRHVTTTCCGLERYAARPPYASGTRFWLPRVAPELNHRGTTCSGRRKRPIGAGGGRCSGLRVWLPWTRRRAPTAVEADQRSSPAAPESSLNTKNSRSPSWSVPTCRKPQRSRSRTEAVLPTNGSA